MMYIIIISCIALVYFLKRSKSNFFFQDREVLAEKRNLLVRIMTDYEFTSKEISEIMEAFDYFRNYPAEFDGATIVKDLRTINGLDAPAMRHDYDYLHIHFWSISGLVKKGKSDWKYGKNMEKLGVSPVTAYTRAVLLLISTPLYYLLLIFKK